MTRLDRQNDSGASLILALIVITVVSLVVGATLSLAFTNFGSTVVLRSEAATSYSADGAAQVAVNQLRTNAFASANCATTSNESLNGFFPASGSIPAGSATIQCVPDPANSTGGGGNTSPGSAILTLGDGTGGERGIWINKSGAPSVKVSGGIFSRSTIYLEGNSSDFENTDPLSYIYALGNCTLNGSKLIPATLPVCNYSTNPASSVDRRGMDPGMVTGHGTSFDAPAAPSTSPALPAACSSASGVVYEFMPGLYRSAAALNAFTASTTGCAGAVMHFNPGTYYFDFRDAGAHKWIINHSEYVVGGDANVTLPITAAKIASNIASGTPTCKVPTVKGTSAVGVKFVFGGDSRMAVSQQAASNSPNIQLCASNSSDGPPIAVYGLKAGIGLPPFDVSAEKDCITQTPYLVEGGDGSHCPVISTDNTNRTSLTIFGTTYTPHAAIDIYLNNNTSQVFRWGLVARTFVLGATGSPDFSQAVISVPADAPAPFAVPSVMYLNVFVCPGSSPCSTAGSPKLRAKVQLSTTTPTTVTVLSWSQQR